MPRIGLRDALRLNVEDSGSGPPVLLLHGFAGCISAWGEAVHEALRTRNRLVAVDLLGHGDSDKPIASQRYALDNTVCDLCEVLDQLSIERAVWVGYSMGGRIALGGAVRRPDRVSALVLEGASPGIGDEDGRRGRAASDDALARTLEAQGIERFVERWLDQPMFRTQKRLGPERLDRMRELRLRNIPRALAACLRGLGTGMQPSFWEQLAEVGAPALLVAGELDEKFKRIGETMQRALPRARLEIISEAGHTTHLEQPEAFVSVVQGFLEKLDE
jgi:2-succinyl-6-hydroxy-2,4-cyclohexadiene-1-carboxylate synthase